MFRKAKIDGVFPYSLKKRKFSSVVQNIAKIDLHSLISKISYKKFSYFGELREIFGLLLRLSMRVSCKTFHSKLI